MATNALVRAWQTVQVRFQALPTWAKYALPAGTLLVAGGIAYLLLRGKSMGSSGASKTAVQRAFAEWQAWPKLTKDQHAAKVLEYINRGALDPRKSIEGYLWCGAFAATMYEGLVHPQVRKNLFPSTYRLILLGKYMQDTALFPYTKVKNGNNYQSIREYHKNNGGERLYQNPAAAGKFTFAPDAGDIVMVGGTDNIGKHITLAVSYDAAKGTVTTISGNGEGVDATGKSPAYGVVMNQYNANQIRALIRLAPADFDSSLVFA